MQLLLQHKVYDARVASSRLDLRLPSRLQNVTTSCDGIKANTMQLFYLVASWVKKAELIASIKLKG